MALLSILEDWCLSSPEVINHFSIGFTYSISLRQENQEISNISFSFLMPQYILTVNPSLDTQVNSNNLLHLLKTWSRSLPNSRLIESTVQGNSLNECSLLFLNGVSTQIFDSHLVVHEMFEMTHFTSWLTSKDFYRLYVRSVFGIYRICCRDDLIDWWSIQSIQETQKGSRSTSKRSKSEQEENTGKKTGEQVKTVSTEFWRVAGTTLDPLWGTEWGKSVCVKDKRLHQRRSCYTRLKSEVIIMSTQLTVSSLHVRERRRRSITCSVWCRCEIRRTKRVVMTRKIFRIEQKRRYKTVCVQSWRTRRWREDIGRWERGRHTSHDFGDLAF